MIHNDIIARYDGMLRRISAYIECQPDPGTSPPHLRWMLRELQTFSDETKAHRWLGFIQGILIARGFTTVTVERDFTRPYLKAAA
ncbi:hypothetical protein GGE68_002912 [Rhizobium leguminosarum]|uniref:hypothetical protein n=1 Tax=Rhizobium leguminosarum TaxID=384 RepID=UPI00160D144F|nr:hypothetical protein [Rhizobium leguminosarum]MBB5664715.1 hypothetical protein [Rhizobium leguminosarum]